MSDTLNRPSRQGNPAGPAPPGTRSTSPAGAARGRSCGATARRTAIIKARHTCSSECGTKAKASSKAEWVQVWADLEAMHPPCLCGAAVVRRPDEGRAKYVARVNCGAPACKKAAGAIGGHTPLPPSDDAHSPAWPPLTGEVDFGGAFGRHNVADTERGVLLRLDRPVTMTVGGVSCGWMAGS